MSIGLQVSVIALLVALAAWQVLRRLGPALRGAFGPGATSAPCGSPAKSGGDCDGCSGCATVQPAATEAPPAGLPLPAHERPIRLVRRR